MHWHHQILLDQDGLVRGVLRCGGAGAHATRPPRARFRISTDVPSSRSTPQGCELGPFTGRRRGIGCSTALLGEACTAPASSRQATLCTVLQTPDCRASTISGGGTAGPDRRPFTFVVRHGRSRGHGARHAGFIMIAGRGGKYVVRADGAQRSAVPPSRRDDVPARKSTPVATRGRRARSLSETVRPPKAGNIRHWIRRWVRLSSTFGGAHEANRVRPSCSSPCWP